MKIFYDLDNTLYSFAETNIDKLMHENIIQYVMRLKGLDHAAGDALSTALYTKYGLTVTGLVTECGIDPRSYCEEIHTPVPVQTLIPRNDRLREMIQGLTGSGHQQYVFTNADIGHGVRCLTALGVQDLFEGNIIDCFKQWEGSKPEYHNKPQRIAYETVMKVVGVNDKDQCVMVEDSAVNLEAPRVMGWLCVWVRRGREIPRDFPYHVIDDILDLPALLSSLSE
eukprot:PhF_6_TR29214/c0_g1_i1/m.42744